MLVPRGAQTPPVRRQGRDSYRQSRPKSMPNLDDNEGKTNQNEPLRSSSSIGNVIASTGESTRDQFSYEARDVHQSERGRDEEGVPQGDTVDHVITLKRDERGFGFRIVGGKEEGTQVCQYFSGFLVILFHFWSIFRSLFHITINIFTWY